jgi:hypothetical protein
MGQGRSNKGVLNPLPSGITDENPHPIDGYEDKPDRDAPIEYTPQKCIRTASIYVETKPASSDLVGSIIKLYGERRQHCGD